MADTMLAPKGTIINSRDWERYPGLPSDELEAFLSDIREQPNWRISADIESDYYDSNQIDAETAAELQARGMAPIFSNLIYPTINTVLGIEAKSRTDWMVEADKDGDQEADMTARAVSVKLKEAERMSRADRAISDAYAPQVKVGLGWVEVSKESDPFKYPYRVKAIHRREIWWDWRSVEPDLSDARYLVRKKWYDADQVMAMFPDQADMIRQSMAGWPFWDPDMLLNTNLIHSFEVERDSSIEQNEWKNTERKRLCLYEVWYRVWVRGHVLRLPDGRVVEFNRNNQMHVEAVGRGLIQPIPATYSKIRLSWYVGPHRMIDMPSPHPHSHFPYIPFWGHREDRTGVPYGLIRTMKPMQDEVNARRQKMLWLLSAKRVIADEDAVKNKDHNAVAQEISRPDAYIILNENRKNQTGFKVDQDFQLSTQQFQIMQESKSMIQDTAGVFNSVMGKKEGGATAGVAISQLIEQGMTTLAEINDNATFGRRMVGELLMANIVADMAGKEQEVRVEMPNGMNKRVALNKPAVNSMGQRFLSNDVTRTNMRVVLSDVPSTPTYRAEMLRQMLELTKSMPDEMKVKILPMLIEATPFPNRKEFAKEVRAAMGEAPDVESMSPEEQAAYEEQTKKQKAKVELAEQVELRVMNATAEEAEFKAAKAKADAAVAVAEASGMGQPEQGDGQDVGATIEAATGREIELRKDDRQARLDRAKVRQIDAQTRKIQIESENSLRERAALGQPGATPSAAGSPDTGAPGTSTTPATPAAQPAPALPPMEFNFQIDAKGGNRKYRLKNDNEGNLTEIDSMAAEEMSDE